MAPPVPWSQRDVRYTYVSPMVLDKDAHLRVIRALVGKDDAVAVATAVIPQLNPESRLSQEAAEVLKTEDWVMRLAFLHKAKHVADALTRQVSGYTMENRRDCDGGLMEGSLEILDYAFLQNELGPQISEIPIPMSTSWYPSKPAFDGYVTLATPASVTLQEPPVVAANKRLRTPRQLPPKAAQLLSSLLASQRENGQPSFLDALMDAVSAGSFAVLGRCATGQGKTLGTLLKAFELGFGPIVCSFPSKALVANIFDQLVSLLGAEHVERVSSDGFQRAGSNATISLRVHALTTELILAGRFPSLLLVDECYEYNEEKERLLFIIHLMLRTNPEFRLGRSMIGLTASPHNETRIHFEYDDCISGSARTPYPIRVVMEDEQSLPYFFLSAQNVACVKAALKMPSGNDSIYSAVPRLEKQTTETRRQELQLVKKTADKYRERLVKMTQVMDDALSKKLPFNMFIANLMNASE